MGEPTIDDVYQTIDDVYRAVYVVLEEVKKLSSKLENIEKSLAKQGSKIDMINSKTYF